MARVCCRWYTYATHQKGMWWLICVAMCFIVVLLVGGGFVLVVWLVKPLQVKVSIHDARLNNFSIGTTQTGAMMISSLAYNMSLALSVDNPNVLPIKFTKPLVAAFVFHDRRIYNITVAQEGDAQKLRKKKQHLLHATGLVPAYVLDTATVEDFKKQNATGQFNLEVRLSGEINWLDMIASKKRDLGLSCPLSLQLAPPGPKVVVFRKVSCKLEEPEEVYF